MTTTDEARAALADALSTAVGEMVTGWTVVVETITDGGKQALWWIDAPEQPSWKTAGQLHWASVRNDSGISDLCSDEEDE